MKPTPQRGVVLVLALVFLGIFVTIATAALNYLVTYAKYERSTIQSDAALALAEAGIDEAVYALNQNPLYLGESDTALGGGTFSVLVLPVGVSTKQITATGYIPNRQSPLAKKTVVVNVNENSTVVSFHYGMQAGNGGFTLRNSSSIIGNVFASGPIVGMGNSITGDVISSGITGLIYGIVATGNAYAHTIGDPSTATTINLNAYYQTIANNVTVGIDLLTPYCPNANCFPGSADQTPAPLPIADAQINQWEANAAAGGTIATCDQNGDYIVTASQSLGNQKIACNLVISGSQTTVTITGPLWITGNLTMQSGPTVSIDPSLAGKTVAIIADNPSNRAGSGIITIGQGTSLVGTQAPGSYSALISQNNSAETGGNTAAISLGQGSSSMVLYASHGLITMGQSVTAKEVTGYKITLSNSASITYDNGLVNSLFQSGPGGSWVVVPGSYSVTN